MRPSAPYTAVLSMNHSAGREAGGMGGREEEVQEEEENEEDERAGVGAEELMIKCLLVQLAPRKVR